MSLRVTSLGASAIRNLPLEQLLPLIYGEALNISLEDFEYNKYHHLYWESPLSFDEEQIEAFLDRIYPSRGNKPWRDALDDILLVILAEGILIEDEEDPWRGYYWYKHGEDYNLYHGSYPNVIRTKYQKLEDLLMGVLGIGSISPMAVPMSKITERDRDILQYIASTQEEKPGYFTRDYQIYHIRFPPTVMSITPINRIVGFYIVRNGVLHIIGADEGGEFYTRRYTGEDIRLIDEIFKYNKD